MPRQRSRSPLSPTLATESATVRLFICVGVLKAGLKTETGFCTACDFAHARPIMLSILLVKLQTDDSTGKTVGQGLVGRFYSRHIEGRTYMHIRPHAHARRIRSPLVYGTIYTWIIIRANARRNARVRLYS